MVQRLYSSEVLIDLFFRSMIIWLVFKDVFGAENASGLVYTEKLVCLITRALVRRYGLVFRNIALKGSINHV